MLPLVYAFVGSFCGGIFFNVRKGSLFWTGLAGSVGWLVYMLLYARIGHSVLCIFAGSVAVGLYSECAARIFKSPTTVYTIPGIFPLVPGIPAYEAIQSLVENQLILAGAKAVTALAGACAIACGILFATAAFRIASKIRSRPAEEQI